MKESTSSLCIRLSPWMVRRQCLYSPATLTFGSIRSPPLILVVRFWRVITLLLVLTFTSFFIQFLDVVRANVFILAGFGDIAASGGALFTTWNIITIGPPCWSGIANSACFRSPCSTPPGVGSAGGPTGH